MEEYKLSEQIYKLKVSNKITLYLIDLDKVAEFTYNKSEMFYEFANIMKKEWLCDMEEYIKDKEDEMLEKTVAYVREFLGDPKNQDLLNHFDSEVRNAKYEGRTEGRVEGRAEGRALEKKQTAINMFKLGITKDLIKGIGMGIPGPVIDQKKVGFFANFPWEKNLNISEKMEAISGITTRLDNDVNVIALGETLYGAGKGFSKSVTIALGTGVGGGILLCGQCEGSREKRDKKFF